MLILTDVLKGKVHLQIRHLSICLLPLMPFQTFVTFFSSLESKEDVLTIVAV